MIEMNGLILFWEILFVKYTHATVIFLLLEALLLHLRNIDVK